MNNCISNTNELKTNIGNVELLKKAKKMGFSDNVIARFWNQENKDMLTEFLTKHLEELKNIKDADDLQKFILTIQI